MELVFFRRGSPVGGVGAEGWPRSLGCVRGFVLMNHSPTSPSTYDKILSLTGSQYRKYVARGAAGRGPRAGGPEEKCHDTSGKAGRRRRRRAVRVCDARCAPCG